MAPLGPLFGVIFGGLYAERSPKGLLEASGPHFGSVLKGLGGVWGGFWDRFEGPNWTKLREKTSCYEFKCEKVFLTLAISCFIDLGSILRYSVGSGEGLGTDLGGKVW